MHYSPTLTAEEFKDLHNAVCELSALSDPNARRIAEHIRNVVLKRVYEEEYKDFQLKSDHYHDMANKFDLKTRWSMFEIGDLSQPHTLGDVTTLIYKEHWGEKTIEVALPQDDKSWLAMYIAADQAIALSGDDHHVFIEDFSPVKGRPEAIELQTGS